MTTRISVSEWPRVKGTDAGFPFHELAHARALTHLGEAEVADAVRFPVLRRRIPGSPWFDGILPWPYVSPDPAEVTALRGAFPDLVSIVGVIRPGSTHRWSDVADVVAAKEHYVFDPSRLLQLSRRACRHVAAGERRWRVEVARDLHVAAEAAAIHARVADLRGFAGSSMEFRPEHFRQLARAPWGIFFTAVGSDGELGATACGALWADEVHLQHILVSAEGLRSSASYVLMAGVTDWCRSTGRSLFIGGQPRTGSAGLARFKARWTNTGLPSHLIRMVVRPEEYRSLRRPAGKPDGFFPAYRVPG